MEVSVQNFIMPISHPICKKDVESLRSVHQHFSDCYIVSALEAFSNSSNGTKMLQNRISYADYNSELLKCCLHSPDGNKQYYYVPVSQAIDGYEKLYKHQDNKIVRALDISVNEYEKCYKTKPLVCRIASLFKNFTFEFNVVSNFMKQLTGKEPTVNIAEKSFNINLKPYKKEVMELFERMDKEKDHSFVIGTGIKKVDDKRWHVYVLEDVNLAENKVTIKNKRGNVRKVIPIEEVLENFKYIVGYFGEDLKHC